MKIGIYGGTFNPIHNGHIALAENAKGIFGLDQVIFLPSGDSYMKSGVLPGQQRYRMVSLALADQEGMEVSDLEIRRQGATYTYQTMEELHGIYPEDELFFLMGEDSLRMIELWKEPARLMQQCSLIVASRLPDAFHRRPCQEGICGGDTDKQSYPKGICGDDTERQSYPKGICGVDTERRHRSREGYKKDNRSALPVQLSQYIRYLEQKYRAHIYEMEMRDPTSSSNIRAAVAQGREIGGMVPAAVRDYIMENSLYR